MNPAKHRSLPSLFLVKGTLIRIRNAMGFTAVTFYCPVPSQPRPDINKEIQTISVPACFVFDMAGVCSARGQAQNEDSIDGRRFSETTTG